MQILAIGGSVLTLEYNAMLKGEFDLLPGDFFDYDPFRQLAPDQFEITL